MRFKNTWYAYYISSPSSFMPPSPCFFFRKQTAAAAAACTQPAMAGGAQTAVWVLLYYFDTTLQLACTSFSAVVYYYTLVLTLFPLVRFLFFRIFATWTKKMTSCARGGKGATDGAQSLRPTYHIWPTRHVTRSHQSGKSWCSSGPNLLKNPVTRE